MSVYIISNGKAYSDHCLYFIDADSSIDMEAACRRATARSGRYAPYKILGIAVAVKWKERNQNAMPLAEWEEGRPFEDWELDGTIDSEDAEWARTGEHK